MERSPPEMSAPDRAEKLFRLALGARLLSAGQADQCRHVARETLAAHPDASVEEIFWATGFVTHHQFRALLRLETYRDERKYAKLLLHLAVSNGRIDIEKAKLALALQKAEYRRSGRTVPIRQCLIEARILDAAGFERIDADIQRTVPAHHAFSDSTDDEVVGAG